MINYQLYIEDQLMDVDEKLSFPLNKILEELNDPTLIKVEWSKTIQLPMTDNNNLFFGNYFRLDNVTVADENGSISGVYFDPTQKLNFRIMYNSDIVMEGYAKMLSNNNSFKKKVYELSLYGKLGEVLNKIKNLTLKKPVDLEEITESDKLYIGYSEDEFGDPVIDNILTEGLKLNKELVKASIDRSNPTLNYDDATDVDIIGFAIANRGLYEEFDSKSFLFNKKFYTIDDYINRFKNVTNSGDFFPDGMNEHEVHELRSYYQKPYVYVNKPIQLIQKWVNNNTDYTLNLSDTWFNANNPYWTNLIMMCKDIDVKKSDNITNSYALSVDTILTMYPSSSPYHNNGDNSKIINLNAISEQKKILKPNPNYQLNIEDDSLNYIFNDEFNITVEVGHSDNTNIRFRLNTGIVLTFYTIPLNSSTPNPHTYSIFLTGKDNFNQETMERDYDQVIVAEFNERVQEGSYVSRTNEIKIIGKHLFTNISGSYRIGMKVKPFSGDDSLSKDNGKTLAWNFCRIKTERGEPLFCYINKNKRSNRYLNFSDLFPDNYKISELFINYVKMFNLMFDVDYNNRTITIIDKTNYYKNYVIEDWSDKIDRTQDMIQTPNTFDVKNILFNYDDFDIKYNKDYKSKYGLNYGSYKLTTIYSFNEETKNLFKGLKPSVSSSEYYLDYKKMQNSLDFNRYLSNRIFPAIFKVDNNKKTNVDSFGQFYFRSLQKDLVNNSGESYPLYLTDDSDVMIVNDNYTWGYIVGLSNSNSIQVNSYPILDIVYITINQKYGCSFAKPAETYTNNSLVYPSGYSSNIKYIYDACWKNWIAERYDVGSKVLTAYFNLNLVDYSLFNFKKFIRIGNTLYSVNKIYDFDVNALKSTKVELLRVTDINNYLNATDVDFLN